jgi:hydrogenase expression/formation protein HypE
MRLLPGKLPPALLTALLRRRGRRDPRVVVGPQFGEDAAAVTLGTHDLVITTDPVTFTRAEAGWYAVHVNANDLAVMGAPPAWFQAAVLLPAGSSAAAARAVFADIDRACRQLGVALTGGHTEVTPAVRLPVVVGTMLGTVATGRLVRSSGARPGDLLVLTKTAGLEGTAILARAHARTLRALLGPAALRRASRLHRVPGISVVREALAAAAAGVSAMHDPTEGGVAMAVVELAAASHRHIELDVDRVPVRPDTAAICDRFGLDPLGLLSSGALLATIAPERAATLLRRLQRLGVRATVIGRVRSGRGVVARRAGRRVPLRASARDELTKLL